MTVRCSRNGKGGMRLWKVLPLLWAIPAQAAIVDIFSGLPQNAGNGSAGPMSFDGYDFAGSFLSPDINFGGVSTTWDPLGLTSNFGADITATIQVAAAGTYTFNTSSDDGSLLFVDGQLVVNNNNYQGVTERQGSIYLSAGAHTMEVQYFQGEGGSALISTLPAGISYVYEAPGLDVYPPLDIYQGATLVGQIQTSTVNFGLPNFDWQPFGLTSNFTAEMTGYFDVATDGTYTFTTGSDDGSYLFIDGQMVVNNGFYQVFTLRHGIVTLSAGQHLFDLQYFQGGGAAALSMEVPAGVTVEPLPEPSTGAPLAAVCGVAAIAALRRRNLRTRR